MLRFISYGVTNAFLDNFFYSQFLAHFSLPLFCFFFNCFLVSWLLESMTVSTCSSLDSFLTVSRSLRKLCENYSAGQYP